MVPWAFWTGLANHLLVFQCFPYMCYPYLGFCSHPELLDRYTGLAQQFAAIDYVAPMNVLWTYHFIHGNPEIAEPIWQNFVKGSNQIMFQKVTFLKLKTPKKLTPSWLQVCQVARATGDIEMAFSLVNHLGEAAQVAFTLLLFLSSLLEMGAFVNVLKILFIQINMFGQLLDTLQ